MEKMVGEEKKSVLVSEHRAGPSSFFVVHVLHSDTAPDPHNKGLYLALVGATGNAEVAMFTPVLPPGISSNLKTRKRKS